MRPCVESALRAGRFGRGTGSRPHALGLARKVERLAAHKGVPFDALWGLEMERRMEAAKRHHTPDDVRAWAQLRGLTVSLLAQVPPKMWADFVAGVRVKEQE